MIPCLSYTCVFVKSYRLRTVGEMTGDIKSRETLYRMFINHVHHTQVWGHLLFFRLNFWYYQLHLFHNKVTYICNSLGCQSLPAFFNFWRILDRRTISIPDISPPAASEMNEVPPGEEFTRALNVCIITIKNRICTRQWWSRCTSDASMIVHIVTISASRDIQEVIVTDTNVVETLNNPAINSMFTLWAWFLLTSLTPDSVICCQFK